MDNGWYISTASLQILVTVLHTIILACSMCTVRMMCVCLSVSLCTGFCFTSCWKAIVTQLKWCCCKKAGLGTRSEYSELEHEGENGFGIEEVKTKVWFTSHTVCR